LANKACHTTRRMARAANVNMADSSSDDDEENAAAAFLVSFMRRRGVGLTRMQLILWFCGPALMLTVGLIAVQFFVTTDEQTV